MTGNRFPIDELKDAHRAARPRRRRSDRPVRCPWTREQIDFYAFSVPEVALRARRDGRPRRARRRVADRARAASYSHRTGYEPTGAFHAAGRRRTLRLRGGRRRRRCAGLDAALDPLPEGRFERAAGDGGTLPRARWRTKVGGRHRARGRDASSRSVSTATPAELVNRLYEQRRRRPRHPAARLAQGLLRLVERRRGLRAPGRRAALRRACELTPGGRRDRSHGQSPCVLRSGDSHAESQPVSEAELAGDRRIALDDVRDVLVELDAELLGALRRRRRGARPAANDGCFSFFCTDFGSSVVGSRSGRTRPHACTKPDSSSQAKSVFFSGVSRGSAEVLGVREHASITSSG